MKLVERERQYSRLLHKVVEEEDCIRIFTRGTSFWLLHFDLIQR